MSMQAETFNDQVIDSVDGALPEVQRALGGYVRASLGGRITVGFRKLAVYMHNHPSEYPPGRFSKMISEGRLIGLALERLCEVGMIELEKAERTNGGNLYVVKRVRQEQPAAPVLIDIGLIDKPAYMLREKSELGPVECLAASILSDGMRVPIEVRRKGVRYELIDGQRRLTAAKNIGLFRVPCTIEDLDDQEAVFRSLLLNLQRESLSPLELSRIFRYMISRGWCIDETQIARRINRSAKWVKQILRILDVSNELQRRVQRKEIGVAEALRIQAQLRQKELDNSTVLQVIEKAQDANLNTKQIVQALEPLKTTTSVDVEKIVQRAAESAPARITDDSITVFEFSKPSPSFYCPCGCRVEFLISDNRLIVRASSLRRSLISA